MKMLFLEFLISHPYVRLLAELQAEELGVPWQTGGG